jgi:signal transduction histidine kinase
MGMTVDQCVRVFDPYERLDREETKKIPGTGLGLFLTRRLVELHGGNIQCDSSPGRGSTFTFWLPACPPTPPAAV